MKSLSNSNYQSFSFACKQRESKINRYNDAYFRHNFMCNFYDNNVRVTRAERTPRRHRPTWNRLRKYRYTSHSKPVANMLFCALLIISITSIDSNFRSKNTNLFFFVESLHNDSQSQYSPPLLSSQSTRIAIHVFDVSENSRISNAISNDKFTSIAKITKPSSSAVNIIGLLCFYHHLHLLGTNNNYHNKKGKKEEIKYISTSRMQHHPQSNGEDKLNNTREINDNSNPMEDRDNHDAEDHMDGTHFATVKDDEDTTINSGSNYPALDLSNHPFFRSRNPLTILRKRLLGRKFLTNFVSIILKGKDQNGNNARACVLSSNLHVLPIVRGGASRRNSSISSSSCSNSNNSISSKSDTRYKHEYASPNNSDPSSNKLSNDMNDHEKDQNSKDKINGDDNYRRKLPNRVPSTTQSSSSPSNSIVDECARSITLSCAVIVGMQTLGVCLTRNDNALLQELISKIFSTETSNALKNIIKILQNMSSHHGIVDVLSLYPVKDVYASIIALSRLQRARFLYHDRLLNNQLHPTQENNGEGQTLHTNHSNLTSKRLIFGAKQQKNILDDNNNDSINVRNIHTVGEYRNKNNKHSDDGKSHKEYAEELDLLNNLAHYAVFAHAAYGWRMGLLQGRLHLGDLDTLVRKTGVEKKHIVATNWKSKTHLPAYFIVRDIERRKIVLCIRGTLTPRDVITDLCCTAEDFLPHDEENSNGFQGNIRLKRGFWSRDSSRAHYGMLESARKLASKCKKLIQSELALYPDFGLVIVGHSLGGGTAAILGSLWKNVFPGLKVYAYGCPCVGPLNSYPTMDKSIVSVVGDGDPFSTLSLGHLADISSALSELCKNHDLRRKILIKVNSMAINKMNVQDLKWLSDKMEILREEVMTSEKFYPPGRILLLSGKDSFFWSDDDHSFMLHEVSQNYFDEIKINPRMFDLSRHVPQRYETILTKIWSKHGDD
mmetsp:Transcript_15311/g.21847  ORF Transcript_15311/g.21847 Transcript_15311/m.21847 type:complete len:947 (-) Transcript_15311:107-2947(-)